MEMNGKSWVAVWTVYLMIMFQVAYWMGRPMTDWVTILQVVLGGYVGYGITTKVTRIIKGMRDE